MLQYPDGSEPVSSENRAEETRRTPSIGLGTLTVRGRRVGGRGRFGSVHKKFSIASRTLIPGGYSIGCTKDPTPQKKFLIRNVLPETPPWMKELEYVRAQRRSWHVMYLM